MYILIFLNINNIYISFSQPYNTNKTICQCGIYRTGNDFMNNILTYKEDCKAGNMELYGGHGNKYSYIIIKNKDTIKIKFLDAWGYRGNYPGQKCDSEDYRYYNNKFYKVLDKGEVIIYKSPGTLQIFAFSNSSKGIKITHYYYSVAPDSEIIKLKKRNIKKTFKNNPKLLAILKNDRSNKKLYEYNKKNKKCHLNYLLEKSKN